MARRVKSFGQQIALWSCAGIGFNVAQRILDHFIDTAIAGHPIFSWLAN